MARILEPLDLWDRDIDPEFRERRLSSEATHQVRAGGALGFYGLH